VPATITVWDCQAVRALDNRRPSDKISPALFVGHHIQSRKAATPLTYVSQKITYAAAAASIGLRNTRETDERSLPLLKNGIVTLGNIDICRDFGFAGDYVEAMYAMLQCDTADAYVTGTGQSHAIRAFCEAAFRHVGCNWANHVHSIIVCFGRIDSHHTVANSAKIAARLGWRPKTTFDELVIMMVDHQIQQLIATGLNSGVP
jgi:GDPmannose 4,6-dehydratase